MIKDINKSVKKRRHEGRLRSNLKLGKCQEVHCCFIQKYKDLNQTAFFRFLTNHYRKYLQKLNVMIRFTKLKLTVNIDLYAGLHVDLTECYQCRKKLIGHQIEAQIYWIRLRAIKNNATTKRTSLGRESCLLIVLLRFLVNFSTRGKVLDITGTEIYYLQKGFLPILVLIPGNLYLFLITYIERHNQQSWKVPRLKRVSFEPFLGIRFLVSRFR